MGSRREEERNEKIIRGLMKLPPNRRCINCNSMGPQYVCTNFWTFVCMTCSGIHREFTHRVKSVSMAKFTSQEVESLQSGGNQRAREAYLRDWDLQRQRLPDNSNVDKVREFIKNVYVDKRYAGGKNSEMPPREVQNLRSPEEETRRASSYHSFSQSPPYDYQYEERRYGKQGGVLTRKPGSDRGLYDRKTSDFVCSPQSEHSYEDRFANEGSVARVSDYSVSSGGDLSRSGAVSPNFRRDPGFRSPPLQSSRGNSSDILNRQTSRGADGIPRPQRTASSGSFGSFDSNTMSLNSFNSSSLVEVVPESEEFSGNRSDKVATLSQSTNPVNSGSDLFQAVSGPEPATPSIDLFQPQFGPHHAASASPIDLFQAHATSSSPSVDLFQLSTVSAPSPIQHQVPQTATATSLNFFADFPQHSHATPEKTLHEPSIPKNEGWATFDSPQSQPTPAAESLNSVEVHPNDAFTAKNFDLFHSFGSNIDWPASQKPGSQDAPSGAPYAWDASLSHVQAPNAVYNAQPWNAFGEPSVDISSMGVKKVDEPLAAAMGHPSISEQYMAFQVPLAGISSQDGASVYKSTNPFDMPFDAGIDQGNLFMDMGSFQAALPDPQLPSSLLEGATQPWFPPNPVTPYVASAPQGGLAFMAGQTATSQIATIPAQGPVASVGGNPFA
ncbi:hypothetical protein SAY87_018648 [Trapa incisa]|uniref:Arf-GAP domain-containing protein n=1 Tax=Trapa incisa TaxID=236973 RepID=A0AAN7K185_9MYRT|nr:hypothetical protein SAY87_018648 [Trapa incisa]